MITNKIYFNDEAFVMDVSMLHESSSSFLQTLSSESFIKSLYDRINTTYEDILYSLNEDKYKDEDKIERIKSEQELLKEDYKAALSKLVK